MDTISGLRSFLKVVEAGGFSAAGRQLGLTASSVARQVDGLESALDTRLLNRSTRSIGLTEAGRVFHDRAQRIVNDLDEACAEVSALSHAPSGTIRLNAPVVFGRRYITRYTKAFLEEHPKVNVELNVTDHFVDLIEEGADLAIRIGGTSQQTYFVRKLATIDRVLCASTDYLERHGRPDVPEDLRDHNCLVYRLNPSQAVVWQLVGRGGRHDIPVAGNFASNNAGAIGAAMVAGVGIALLASVEGGEIVKALLERDVDVSTTAEEFAVEGNANGLRARDVKIGGGASAKRGDFVGVNLTVVDAEDGVEYLNTKKAKRPIAFTYEKKPLLAPICEAIEDGVRTMKRGGVRRVFAPSAAAFGERGVVLTDGTRIKPNRDLIIDIVLEEVSPSYV